jgi:hypothetical protein
VVFREIDREFVEYHCWLIEQPDETLYISAPDPHVVIVGQWSKRWGEITTTRQRIARSNPFRGARDPLCDEPKITFRISGNSVIGNAGGTGDGIYSPVTRLVAPAFEMDVRQARNSTVTCGEPH